MGSKSRPLLDYLVLGPKVWCRAGGNPQNIQQEVVYDPKMLPNRNIFLRNERTCVDRSVLSSLRRRPTRRVPAAFTCSLIDEEPAAIWGVPFRDPARRKVMIGARRRRALMRGRGPIEGTFACALIDADLKSASRHFERMPASDLKIRRMRTY